MIIFFGPLGFICLFVSSEIIDGWSMASVKFFWSVNKQFQYITFSIWINHNYTTSMGPETTGTRYSNATIHHVLWHLM